MLSKFIQTELTLSKFIQTELILFILNMKVERAFTLWLYIRFLFLMSSPWDTRVIF